MCFLGCFDVYGVFVVVECCLSLGVVCFIGGCVECRGSISVSSFRCCMFVSCVQPVAMRNAVFCTACSFCMLVVDAMGDHMVVIHGGTYYRHRLWVSWAPL